MLISCRTADFVGKTKGISGEGEGIFVMNICCEVGVAVGGIGVGNKTVWVGEGVNVTVGISVGVIVGGITVGVGVFVGVMRLVRLQFFPQ
jgi:hypothetical protein